MIQIRRSGIPTSRSRGRSFLGRLIGWLAMRDGSLRVFGKGVAEHTMRSLQTTVSDCDQHVPSKRSSDTLQRRRISLPWPEGRDFRILSIDGGGIRGIFPAAFLAGLERRCLGRDSISAYFDLIAGTSTGGIIALGLASGYTATEICRLYVERGCEIFPPIPDNWLGDLSRHGRRIFQLFKVRYDRESLLRILRELFGTRSFGDTSTLLCIPSFDGCYGEPYIFKTPHHPDYRLDRHELAVKVAAATAAAPTYYAPMEDRGYRFIDGGVWANNPVMIALVDALSCYEVPRERVRVLSLGCGNRPYTVGKVKAKMGGAFAWHDIMYAAMRLQSHNAIGQAGLLIGRDRIIRVDAPAGAHRIALDDWSRAVTTLPQAAEELLEKHRSQVASVFLQGPAATYRPAPAAA